MTMMFERAPASQSERLPIALIASSALSVAFVFVRVTRTMHLHYVFLLWNLLLAWMPYVLARIIAFRARKGAGLPELSMLGIVFLGFLPNAPYLVTDLMHLHRQSSVPYWYDALMLASFGWAGLVLGVASLQITASVLRARTSKMVSVAYVLSASILVAFGIYLGRFLRLNTWDAAVHPLKVLECAIEPVIHPVHHAGAWIFTAAFSAFFLASYASLSRRVERA